MKTPVKIAIGLAATAIGTLAMAFLRKRKATVQRQYTAPDGTLYDEGQIYRSADHKTYQNGREIRNAKPEDHFVTDASHSSHPNASTPNHYKETVKNVQYHQKGVRHR
ncbi:hypothetical protein QGN23_00450 [Chryseobacterium gotjawalense]|uniref:Uncharacterized protein n=2 Tax=Chryseobacterium TaxID=59732 RepID=A0A4P6ZGL5_9FLAO|nr:MULTISPECIES: hypothetical protein [Chryseobacterium]MDQ0477139.1 hypothetical protein [Chryseobacterium sp. MDT2-18]QBO58729.1 hypothetical protein NBC122_01921 [Chryseobacterium salivictor]WHF51765.1 hypothetical protein QGN23_00450 [Chryseobacterium sp. wdc7]